MFAANVTGEARRPGRVARSGYLHFRSALNAADAALRKVFRDLGWMEGENIVIECR